MLPPLKRFLFLLLATAVSIQAQKIGYVSTDAIKKRYEPYLMAEQRLNQMVEEWRAEIDQMQKDIEGMELEIKKNRLIWSDSEREQFQKELEQKRRKREDFAKQVFEPGGRYDKEVESMMKEIWEKVYLGIQQAAAAEGYDIVWDKSTDPLVYVNPKFDLTVKVMKVLGISADSLEKKQLQVIDSDPRNQQARAVRSRTSRRRSTSRSAPDAAETTESPAKPLDGTPNNLPPMEKVNSPQPDTTKSSEDIPR